MQLGNNTALGGGDLGISGNSTPQAGTAVSVANNIALADMTTVDNNGNNFTLGGILSGGGGIAKINSGKLTLNGANIYTGNTAINAGTVSISADANFGAVGASQVVLNGGDLLGSATFGLDPGRNVGIGPAAGSAGTNALIDVASGQALTINGVIATAGNGGVNNLGRQQRHGQQRHADPGGADSIQRFHGHFERHLAAGEFRGIAEQQLEFQHRHAAF